MFEILVAKGLIVDASLLSTKVSLLRFGSLGPSEDVIRYRSELAERDWENAVQGQDKAPLVTQRPLGSSLEL